MYEGTPTPDEVERELTQLLEYEAAVEQNMRLFGTSSATGGRR
jgi:hypothetical protein